MAKNYLYIPFLFKKTIRLFDLCLKVFLELLFILFLPFLRLGFKVINPEKDVICLFKRYQDTIERHNSVSTPNFLNVTFRRRGFSRVIVLCVGNGDYGTHDWGDGITGVDLKLFQSKILYKIFPHFSNSLRDIFATIIAARYLKQNKIGFLETDFPSNVVIRIIRLKIICDVKIIARVIGNMDLIYHQVKFPTFFPFQIRVPLIEKAALLYDSYVAFILFNLSAVIIGGARNSFDNAISKGASPDKTFLVRMSIDRQMFSCPLIPRKKLEGFPNTGKNIVIWSRLNKDMMIDKVVFAIKNLLRKNKNYNLVIIGDGPEKTMLQEMSRKYSIIDQVFFLGYRPRSFIRSAAAHADVVCLPYGGLSLIEASFLQCPVVAFDYEWANELIIDGYSGLLADWRDPLNIEHKISYMISSKEHACIMAKNLSLLVKRIFDEETLASQQIEAYRSLFNPN